MRLVVTAGLMSTLRALGCVYPLTAQSVCRPADALTARTVTRLQTLVTSTDAIGKASRDSLRVASTTAANVKLIVDSRTCQKPLGAFNATQGTPTASRLVYVYQIGKVFGVEDPMLEGSGEYRALRMYDSKWTYLSTMATF